MRDFLFLGCCLVLVTLSFRRPLIAYLAWGWTAVLVPGAYLYGFMGDVRINLIFALLSIFYIVIGKVKLPERGLGTLSIIYVIFGVHATFCFLLAFPGNADNLRYYEILVKGLVFALCMPFFVKSRDDIHALLIVVTLGLLFHGVLDGLKTLASAGRHNMPGVEGGMLGDRNHLSVAIALVIPIGFYLYLHSKRSFVRAAYLGGLFLAAIAVLGSGSRGGFIVMCVLAIWFFATTRHKLNASLIVAVLAIGFIAFAPERWTDRLSSIEDANLDSSFLGRVVAWQISSAIAFEHPFFGAGFHAVQVQAIWDAFKYQPGLLSGLSLPSPDFSAKAAHSIYFEVMGDMGLVGLAIFLSMFGYAYRSRRQVVGLFKRADRPDSWLRDLSDMLFLSVVSFMVGGAAVSLAYFEVIYLILMLLEIVRRLAAEEQVQSGVS